MLARRSLYKNCLLPDVDYTKNTLFQMVNVQNTFCGKSHYAIYLLPDQILQEFTFSGMVIIQKSP